MKLAIVTETFPPEVNGVAMTYSVIARELGRRGHRVTVYRPRRADLGAADANSDYTEVAMPGVPIPRYPMLRLGLPAGRALQKRWMQERPDLVHVATEGPLGATAVSAARRIGIPVTSSFHTNFHAYTPLYGFGGMRRLVLGWLRHVHNRTCLTFAPTRELCGELEALGFANLKLMSRGVDTYQFHPARRSDELRRRWGAGDYDPVVIHAGRMAAEKNYELLFRCYDAMRAANPRCRFVVVGDGPLRVKWERAQPEVVFTGFIPREELARHYASADIYIHASLTETFGNVLLEAMASSLAVAAFDYAAAREFVRDGDNGYVVPCARPEALIAVAVKLVSDPLRRANLRQAARQSLDAQSWGKVISQFETDLLAAANNPPAVAAAATLT